MIQTFSDYYKIDSKKLTDMGTLDPVLGIDTRLFIDPRLLAYAKTPELTSSYQKLLTYFEDILRVVRQIKNENDLFWKTADRKLKFPEVNGLCIGYADDSYGRGMGDRLRHDLLKNIRSVVDAGINDPVLFELVGIFQENIGPDRISDMVAKIIIDDLILYTQRICKELGIPLKSGLVSQQVGKKMLPENPVTKKPIILVPQEILNDLPMATKYGDIAVVAGLNQELRDTLNVMIGGALSKMTTTEKKQWMRKTFINYPDILQNVIDRYLKDSPSYYDYASDPTGEVSWFPVSREITKASPLELSLPKEPSIDDIEGVVVKICEQFRNLIENNQLAKLLYNSDGTRKHESAAQLVFFGIASSYCAVNDLDITPEANSGRGPVDFKFSKGFSKRVLVEVKLTSNQQLSHGYASQLPIYQKAEGGARGVYLVIDNGGASKKRMESFRELIKNSGEPPRVMWVDGVPRESASRADH